MVMADASCCRVKVKNWCLKLMIYSGNLSSIHDLRRWGLYTTGAWWDHRPTNDDHYELFPIPEKSISVSNVLRQNPGYGGGNEMTKEEAGIYSVKQID